MVNRIIITDGNWDSDTLILLPRPTLPHTLDLPAGNYVVVNTASNPDPATATDAPAQNGSPSATAPATDTLTVGAVYSADFRSRFSDPDGDPLIFAMTGTPPPGIARTNASFAGTPTTTGSYSVTLTASDPSGASASIGISWTVAAQPQVALTVTPSSAVTQSSPVGTGAATISTDATALTLGGDDGGLLQISGDQIVTTAALTGRTGLSFTVTGTRSGYTARTRTASISVAASDQGQTDTTAPIISEEDYDIDTGAMSFSITEGGMLRWAIHWGEDGLPTLNSDGTWTGTTIETGQATVPAGDGTLDIAFTTDLGNRIAYGVIDAAGNVSNIIRNTVMLGDIPLAPRFVGMGQSVWGIGNLTAEWPAGHQAGDLAVGVLLTRGTDPASPAPAGWTKQGRYAQGTASGDAVVEVFHRTAAGAAEEGFRLPDSWNTGLLTMAVYRPAGSASLVLRHLGNRTEAANTVSGRGTVLTIPTATTAAAARGRILAVIGERTDNAARQISQLSNKQIQAWRERSVFGTDQNAGGWLTLADGVFENGPTATGAINATYPVDTSWVSALFEIVEQ